MNTEFLQKYLSVEDNFQSNITNWLSENPGILKERRKCEDAWNSLDRRPRSNASTGGLSVNSYSGDGDTPAPSCDETRE